MFKDIIMKIVITNALKEGYKNVEVIKKYISGDKGKILPRRITGACAKHQRHIATQVKYARHMALIPFVK